MMTDNKEPEDAGEIKHKNNTVPVAVVIDQKSNAKALTSVSDTAASAPKKDEQLVKAKQNESDNINEDEKQPIEPNIDSQQDQKSSDNQDTQPTESHKNSTPQQDHGAANTNAQQIQTQATYVQEQPQHYPYGYYSGMEDFEMFQVHNDIYNTYALLKSRMIRTETGYSTLWDETFTSVDKFIFYFFFVLVAFIQIAGFLVLYLDADEIATALKETADNGDKVYFNGGSIDFIVPNNATLLTNHEGTKLNISSGTFQLFETNPKVPTDIDYSVLFTIVIADICMVFLFFKELTQLGQLYRLTRFLPELHQHKTLIQRLFWLKIIILICASIASLVIIALATTSIEAMEKAVAIFFLFEISSWVYVLIRQHPEIHDDLYVLQIDLRQVYGVDEQNKTQQYPAAQQQLEPAPHTQVVHHDADLNQNPQQTLHIVHVPPIVNNNQQIPIDYEQLEYDAYNRVQHDFAFSQVFLMTVTFLCAYIGIQFFWWLPYPDVGGIMFAAVVLCIIIQCFVKQTISTRVQQLIQEQMLSESHKTS